MQFAGGGGCEQVIHSLSEESPAFPDMVKDAGPIEQRYSIKLENCGLLEQRCSVETKNAGPIDHRYYIKTVEAASIEKTYSLIKTEDAGSLEQEHHSVYMEDAASAEKDVNMEVKSSETYFSMPSTMKKVWIFLLYDLLVY